METVPMTQEGKEKLQAQLKDLENQRPTILKAIQTAREKGDLSENAEYHAAREDLGLLEANIRDLESKLSRAQVVDKSKMTGGEIVFGATVKLLCLDDDDEEEFTLVGAGDEDPLSGKILTTSPMAQALLNKKVDDEVEVPVPKGTIKYKVLDIRFEG